MLRLSPVPIGPGLIRGLQERVARALPAQRIDHVDGWWLHYAPGSSWWIGTVLPHNDASGTELAGLIAIAEQFYASYGVPTRFQISPGACPTGLDSALAARGYRQHTSMSLQTATAITVSSLTHPGGPSVRLATEPTTAWLKAWHTVHGHGSDPQIERDMLARVRQPGVYATVADQREVVAVGRAVADTGWVGVFGMATLPHARGRGAGRSILAALAAWAPTQRADRMYLEVETTNDAALRLYSRTGFRQACGYHYRATTS